MRPFAKAVALVALDGLSRAAGAVNRALCAHTVLIFQKVPAERLVPRGQSTVLVTCYVCGFSRRGWLPADDQAPRREAGKAAHDATCEIRDGAGFVCTHRWPHGDKPGHTLDRCTACGALAGTTKARGPCEPKPRCTVCVHEAGCWQGCACGSRLPLCSNRGKACDFPPPHELGCTG
jgi:hypothetical protein